MIFLATPSVIFYRSRSGMGRDWHPSVFKSTTRAAKYYFFSYAGNRTGSSANGNRWGSTGMVTITRHEHRKVSGDRGR